MENVLAAHDAETVAAEADGFWIKCRCGAIGEVESDAEDWCPANEWIAKHQAEALALAGFGNLHDAWAEGYESGEAVGSGVCEYDPTNPFPRTEGKANE